MKEKKASTMRRGEMTKRRHTSSSNSCTGAMRGRADRGGVPAGRGAAAPLEGRPKPNMLSSSVALPSHAEMIMRV